MAKGFLKIKQYNMAHIWKYEIPIQDNFEMKLPIGAKILSVQTQQERACMWVLILHDEPNEECRSFQLFGTGHTIPGGLNRKYIGTFQYEYGQLVYHLFEILQP